MIESSFSKEEFARYNRHIILPGFGIEGQQKLQGARVLVVGAGGLGAPLLQYLTAAGVGTIGIADFDVVDESNLQRQVLFTEEDKGKSKVDAAISRLQAQNHFVKFIPHKIQLNSSNALSILRDYDIVADGTDNFPTRYLVNDACVLLGKINVFASIFRFDGQVSVFNYPESKGERGPNYRDLFPQPPPPGTVPSCAEGGVLGVLPGIIGSMQANEIIKVITGVGEVLSGKLWVFDALTNDTRIFKFHKDPSNPVSGTQPSIHDLIDYDEFCGIKSDLSNPVNELREITVQELQRMKNSLEDFQLIDVREPWEYEIANLGGELIPKGEIKNQVQKIRRSGKVVVHCRSGKRSADVIHFLQKEYQFTNLFNLKGGILAWSDEIDSSISKY